MKQSQRRCVTSNEKLLYINAIQRWKWRKDWLIVSINTYGYVLPCQQASFYLFGIKDDVLRRTDNFPTARSLTRFDQRLQIRLVTRKSGSTFQRHPILCNFRVNMQIIYVSEKILSGVLLIDLKFFLKNSFDSWYSAWWVPQSTGSGRSSLPKLVFSSD